MTILFASHNKNKIKEVREILSLVNIEVKSSSELGIDDPIEDGLNFKENALLYSSKLFR